MQINNNSIWVNKNLNAISERSDIMEPIQKLSLKLKTFADMDEAINILNEFKETNENVSYDPKRGVYRYLNYYIIPGLKADDTTFISNLKFINRLGYCRTSAPEIIHYGVSDDNKFNVIIYKLNDTNGGPLIPLKSLKEIAPDKKIKFLNEQIRLLEETGLYNKAVIDSYDYWCLTPDTHNVFIDSWENLNKCTTPKEKANVKKILKNRI